MAVKMRRVPCKLICSYLRGYFSIYRGKARTQSTGPGISNCALYEYQYQNTLIEQSDQDTLMLSHSYCIIKEVVSDYLASYFLFLFSPTKPDSVAIIKSPWAFVEVEYSTGTHNVSTM